MIEVRDVDYFENIFSFKSKIPSDCNSPAGRYGDTIVTYIHRARISRLYVKYQYST